MSVTTVPRWEAAYAEAHAERFRVLARRPGAESRRGDGVLAVRTGAWSNTDNGVVLERDDVDPDLVAELVRWFRRPASLICSGFDAPEVLRERLSRLRLREEVSGVTSGAVLDGLDLPPPDAPPGISIAEAQTDAGVDAWLAVAHATRILEEDGRQPLPVRHWVARRGSRPIGLATAFFTLDTVLLEHVAVVEGERRRGTGTALALVRLHEAKRLGCRLAVFGTTPDSGRLYDRLGFTTQAVAGGRWFYLPTP